jgi:hypothetical protein
VQKSTCLSHKTQVKEEGYTKEIYVNKKEGECAAVFGSLNF